MELYQLRHFVAIVDTGSFTRASVRAAVSQPALSASIARLEEELGVKLLHRTPRAITPTSAGRTLIATAREVLAACNKVKADLRAAALDRPLRVGVLRTLPTAHLARLVGAIRQGISDTKVELHDGSADELERHLLDRKVVACITSKGSPREGRRSIELVREAYGLVASATGFQWSRVSASMNCRVSRSSFVRTARRLRTPPSFCATAESELMWSTKQTRTIERSRL